MFNTKILSYGLCGHFPSPSAQNHICRSSGPFEALLQRWPDQLSNLVHSGFGFWPQSKILLDFGQEFVFVQLLGRYL